MPTIYKTNSDRISIADAKRLILDAAPLEPMGHVYAQLDEHGEIDGLLEIRLVPDTNIYEAGIDCDFLNACKLLDIKPRNMYRPIFTDYTGDCKQDDYYTIAHEEFARYAELFDLRVATGAEPEKADTQPQAAPVYETGSTPWHLLATPTELIDAFGKYTGMDKAWFNNVKDTPKLEAARHTAGQGGRNGREPLYYVMSVMQWLADPKRRKGRSMGEAAGWRVLEHKFPEVHEEYLGQKPDME